ncbi:hypothetical protein A2U01_0114666, partial [Trifolium medium]|nr:hypothetical protein [Trifolium medium]
NSKNVLCSDGSNYSGTVNPASSTCFKISLDSGTRIRADNSEFMWNFIVVRGVDRSEN